MRWLGRRILFEGSSLRLYEREVVEAAATVLTCEQAAAVLLQLGAVEAVQRSLKGRHGMFLYGDDKAGLARLSDGELTVKV